ncbi:MAG: D-2-hydroxyacid dehydrogenase [Lachnospiraceae bacterium]|jgi:phosphoglycerate dehydrogenase-like enzyme|nr:D-2-hydroxyacid dehydrogenase [Lachnospiraceae bacterium]
MEKREKTVLVVLPAEDRHRALLESRGQGSLYDLNFIYEDASEVSEGDLSRADVIIGNLPPRSLSACTHLEWMQLNSAGADAYAVPGVLPEKAVLTCATGAYGTAVSEHMLALTFGLIRHLGPYRLEQAKHIWSPGSSIISVEDSVVLVLGLGDIGGSYARKMHALGAKVIGVRMRVREKPDYLDEQYTADELDSVLGRADIVAMVLPGGASTEHIMDGRRLGLMKAGSYLINVGRGNAVDPAALKRALRSGHLAGAGLDVTEPEPLPPDDELWDMQNVIITPHVAGQFYLPATFERIVAIAGDNLHAYANGRPLSHVVDRGLGYQR